MFFKPTIVREPVKEMHPKCALAEKAASVLGYRGLRAYGNSEALSVFTEMGIEPLNTTSVFKYKRWYAKKHGGGFHWQKIDWRAVNISDYHEEIPEFALSHAVELKEKLPNATFVIEFPVKEEVIHPDPFLRMDYKGASYYIDVWDEPEFEGRKTV